jgi:hypothetical protein
VAGRVEVEHHPNQRREDEGQDHRRRDDHRPVRHAGRERRRPHPQQNPNDAAARRKHHRLHQKLQQHILLLGTHGHPDADLTRPLGYRDEHDVRLEAMTEERGRLQRGGDCLADADVARDDGADGACDNRVREVVSGLLRLRSLRLVLRYRLRGLCGGNLGCGSLGLGLRRHQSRLGSRDGLRVGGAGGLVGI